MASEAAPRISGCIDIERRPTLIMEWTTCPMSCPRLFGEFDVSILSNFKYADITNNSVNYILFDHITNLFGKNRKLSSNQKILYYSSHYFGYILVNEKSYPPIESHTPLQYKVCQDILISAPRLFHLLLICLSDQYRNFISVYLIF